MFFGSFYLLYWNEGRVNVANIARTAVEVPASGDVSAELDKSAVYTSGNLTSDEQLGDEYLVPGDYLVLQRNVEMFSWEEEETTTRTTTTGGSETKETTYTYKQVWDSNPEDSTKFQAQVGHENPLMTINENHLNSTNAKIGDYQIDLNSAQLPPLKDLTLSQNNIIEQSGVQLGNNQFLFSGIGTLAAPQIGDIRISYSVISNPLNSVVVFGQLNQSNSSIDPFYGDKETKLYRIFEGTRETAISTMQNEHTTLSWGLRVVGFFLMWMGLMTLLGPISTVLDILPFLGSVSRSLLGLATFFIALILSTVTILISMIIHNLIALIIAVTLIIGGIIWLLKMKSQTPIAEIK